MRSTIIDPQNDNSTTSIIESKLIQCLYYTSPTQLPLFHKFEKVMDHRNRPSYSKSVNNIVTINAAKSFFH